MWQCLFHTVREIGEQLSSSLNISFLLNVRTIVQCTYSTPGRIKFSLYTHAHHKCGCCCHYSFTLFKYISCKAGILVVLRQLLLLFRLHSVFNYLFLRPSASPSVSKLKKNTKEDKSFSSINQQLPGGRTTWQDEYIYEMHSTLL